MNRGPVQAFWCAARLQHLAFADRAFHDETLCQPIWISRRSCAARRRRIVLAIDASCGITISFGCESAPAGSAWLVKFPGAPIAFERTRIIYDAHRPPILVYAGVAEFERPLGRDGSGNWTRSRLSTNHTPGDVNSINLICIDYASRPQSVEIPVAVELASALRFFKLRQCIGFGRLRIPFGVTF